MVFLYVGYDDGIATRNLDLYGYGLGQTKAYLKFPFSRDGSTQITSAKLILDRYTAYSNRTRTVRLYNIDDNNFNIYNVCWAKQPTNKSYYASTTVDGTIRPAEFDVKNLLNDWINGARKNNGIELEYDDGTQQCEVYGGLTNPYGDPPHLEIESKIVDPVDPNMPFGAPKINVEPITEHNNKGFLNLDGIFADGVEKPGAIVDYSIAGTNFYGKVTASMSYLYPDSTFFKSYFPNAPLIKGNATAFSNF